jgi:hypothetical protein
MYWISYAVIFHLRIDFISLCSLAGCLLGSYVIKCQHSSLNPLVPSRKGNELMEQLFYVQGMKRSSARAHKKTLLKSKGPCGNDDGVVFWQRMGSIKWDKDILQREEDIRLKEKCNQEDFVSERRRYGRS